MSDQPASPDRHDQHPSEPTAGVSARRQLVFPEAVAQDNQVRARIPLVTQAPVFEFEPIALPTPSGPLKLLRRKWMRLRQFVSKYVVWLVVTLLLSVVVVLIVAVISPVPKPSAPPVRR